MAWVDRGVDGSPARRARAGGLRLHRLGLRLSVLLTAVALTVVPVISKVQVATVLGVAFAVGVCAAAGALPRSDWRAGAPALALIAGLTAWAALGLSWAVDPTFSAEKFGRVLPILALGPAMVAILGIAGRVDGSWLARVLPIAVVAALGWILVGMLLGAAGPDDAVRSGGTLAAVFPSGVGVNPGLTTLAIVVWLLPIAAGSKRVSPVFAVIAIATAVFLATGESDAAIVGFGLGGAVFLIGLWRVRVGTAAMVLIVSASALGPIVAAPVAYERAWNAIEGFPNSWLHRVEIWDAAVDHASQHRLGGSGIDSFRLLEHDQPTRLRQEDPQSAPADPPRPQGQAMHPHHALLQVWVETGLIGALLSVALAVWVIRKALSWPDRSRAAAQAALTATGVILCLSYGVWQGWWLALLFAVAGYAAGLVAGDREDRRTPAVQSGESGRPPPA